MKPNSTRLFSASLAVAVAAGISGCSESWQKKFVRKRPASVERPSPVVRFQDYAGAMTPLERYRKHFLMFEYWNLQLLDELAEPTANPRRFRRASEQSLEELRQLHALLAEAKAQAVEPIVAARGRLDQQIQAGPYHPANLSSIRMSLDAQTRQIDREMDWRHVDQELKPPQAVHAR